MTDVLRAPVWAYWVKGRPVRTDAPVRLYECGNMSIPPAAIAALGFPERIHLFVAEHEPGLLWLCPAEPDDVTGYRLAERNPSSDIRVLTVAGLSARLRVDADLDVALGEWTIEDDRMVVRFPVEVAS